MTIDVLPVLLVLVISVTPGISPKRRSKGAAMLAAIVSGSAPGRAANTTMVGISTLGSGATGRKRTATSPISSRPSASRNVGDRAADERGRDVHSAGAATDRTKRCRVRSNAR